MRRYISKFLLVISVIICTYFFLFYGKESYPFYGDSMGYYMYLPSTFIYHNHKALDWLPQDKHFDKSIWSCMNSIRKNEPRTPKGYIINKYTYGVAAMEMPFFFIAHGYEKIRGKEANGYSFAYKVMLKTSSICYALLGLIILYKILSSFFDPDLSLKGTLAILMGTNLFWFALCQAGMAHVPLFFLYALLIYTTILIHKKPHTSLFILSGLIAGLITVIRPTDIVCLLIPLLYNVYDRATVTQKIMLLKEQYKGVLCFAIAFIIPLIPQMLYWKKFAGSYLYYSYGTETFNWLHPKIFDGIFSFANGWLIYSPVMIFSILGFLFYKKIKPASVILFILLPLYIYIAYSWYCYNYINGLGSRPMINIYPLLALPLTAFIQYASQRKRFLKWGFSILFLFFISINISYSFQQAKEILFSEESNMTYNLHMLFKMSANYNDLVTHDVQQLQPDSNSIEKVSTLACENYEDSTSDHYVPDPTKKSKYVYHMFDDEEYHPKKIVITYNRSQFGNADWLKCSGTFLCTKPFLYYKHMFTLDILRGEKTISWYGCQIDNKIGLTEPNAPKDQFYLYHSALNKWGNVYFLVKIPKDIIDGDKIRLDVWNLPKQEIYFDNICLELYKDK